MLKFRLIETVNFTSSVQCNSQRDALDVNDSGSSLQIQIRAEDGKFGLEAKRIQEALGGFDWRNSCVLQVLHQMFSSGVTHAELISIAELLCQFTSVSLHRCERRSTPLLIKWYHDNWATIFPHLSVMNLRDEHSCPITGYRELCESAF
jgi:hypothetical protein